MSWTDIFGQIGQIGLFLLRKYYDVMVFFYGFVSPLAGVPAAFLASGLVFVVFPLILLVQACSYAVGEAYVFFEWSWNGAIKTIIILLVVFGILFVVGKV